MTRFSTSDFCESCLKIGCGEDRSITVKDFLDSPGYAHPLVPANINYAILFGLEDNGGCPSCINKAKSATIG